MMNREENPHKPMPDVTDPGYVVSASGPARGDEPAESQIVPWADDFLEECEARLAEFNATADKESPDYPGALADIVNEVRAEFERDYEQFGYRIPPGVKEILGDHLIGPEAYKKIFGAKDLGEIPPIPAHITKELLSQKCYLTQDGSAKYISTIAETHRLVFIPAKIDGDPFTIMRLANLAESAGAALGRPTMFQNTSWYKNESFANTAKKKGEWLLVPMTDLPNSRSKTYDEQNAQLQNYRDASTLGLVATLIMNEYPDYRGASTLELVTTLIMNDLILQPRRENIGAYYNHYGRCTDTSASGVRVCAGFFDARGLVVAGFGDFRYDYLGRGVVLYVPQANLKMASPLRFLNPDKYPVVR
jgi:hypothetical protein